MISPKALAFRRLAAGAAAVFAVFISTAATAQQTTKNPIKKSGKYAVELRLPPEGLFAGEEIDIEFRVTDTSQEDPVQGAPPVVKAKVAGNVTMPAMPSMPAQKLKTHAEGVPGDYGVVCFFPHGGDYQVDLTITPPEDKPFTVSFRVPVEDEGLGQRRKPKPKPYTLEISASPAAPRAGEPTDLTIVVRSRETGKPVTDFEIVHEQLMHFIIVTKDLSHFAHEHPVSGKEGRFTHRYTFPFGGEYRLFADVAPRGAGSQVLMQSLRVSGSPPPANSLKPAAVPSDTVNGVKITMQTETAKLAAGRMMPLTFTVRQEATDAAVTDIEPWLGAMAHLILIHQDGVSFVHSHTDETDPMNGKNGSLTFLGRFPKAGLYRGWLQFQRGGQVHTATFVVDVKGKQG